MNEVAGFRVYSRHLSRRSTSWSTISKARVATVSSVLSLVTCLASRDLFLRRRSIFWFTGRLLLGRGSWHSWVCVEPLRVLSPTTSSASSESDESLSSKSVFSSSSSSATFTAVASVSPGFETDAEEEDCCLGREATRDSKASCAVGGAVGEADGEDTVRVDDTAGVSS